MQRVRKLRLGLRGGMRLDLGLGLRLSLRAILIQLRRGESQRLETAVLCTSTEFSKEVLEMVKLLFPHRCDSVALGNHFVQNGMRCLAVKGALVGGWEERVGHG